MGAGLPHPDVKKGMSAEHTFMTGCDYDFTTDNYGVTTNLRREYEISTGKRECPESERKDKDGKLVRVVRPIAELMRLPLVEQAELTEEEILAFVSLLLQPLHPIPPARRARLQLLRAASV